MDVVDGDRGRGLFRPGARLRSVATIALLATVALGVSGFWYAAQGQNTVTVAITDPGGDASGSTIDLTSFASALASVNDGNALRLEWPGASNLGENLLANASVTTTPATESIVIAGDIEVDAVSQSGLLIIDWDGVGSTPTVSLGVKGTLDLAALNDDWTLEGSAFQLDGSAVISSGDQVLTGVNGVSAFYGGQEAIAPGLEIEGAIAIDRILPGFGPNASTAIVVGASLEADIGALLTDADYDVEVPITFSGSIAADQLAFANAPSLAASSFDVSLTLAGQGADQEFQASATGSVTIDDDSVASNAVTFTVNATTDGSDVSLAGGLADGQTWDDPFGVSGLTFSEIRLGLDAPAGETATLSLTVQSSLSTAAGGEIGIEASVELNDEVAVELSVSAITVADMVSVFGALGVDTGSGANDLNDLDPELATLQIEPTSIRLRTEAGEVFGSASTGISFRSKTATILMAGGTGADDGLLVAVTLPELTIGDLAPTLPTDIKSTSLPSGGFIFSSKELEKGSFDAGDIEDAYLSNLFCGPAVAAADCDYTVSRGLGLAAQMELDNGIRKALNQLVPLSAGPVRVDGTIPIFGDGDLDLNVELPPISPAPGSDAAEWLVEARLGISITLGSGEASVALTGTFDTKWEDETEADGFDYVTFSVSAGLELGSDGPKVEITGTVGAWDTPMGIDWIDLNGLRLEIIIAFKPTPGVQVGIAASATLKSACAAFGGTNCPPPSTFEAAFAVGFAAGPKIDVGFRLFADAITLRDVAAIAKEMGANIEPDELPDASLRNVEFAFSTIDAEELCLQRGLIISADIYLDSPMASQGAGDEVERKVCSDTSISPEEGIASCAADSSCLAHLRLSVSDQGFEAAASLNNISFGPVTVNSASIALALTESDQYFAIAGDVSIENFAEVEGSLRITPTQFEFSLETSDSSGNKVAISGAFGFDPDVPGFAVELDVFVRLPGLNQAFLDSQALVSEVSQAFTGEPLGTVYSFRCLEINVDLVVGGDDPISGDVNAKVHFSAIDTATGYEDGKIWTVGWDFDAPITNNVTNLVGSLSGQTSTDTTGCQVEPTLLGMLVGGFDYGAGDPNPPLAIVNSGTNLPVDLAWRSNDFSEVYVELDTGDGTAPITFGPSQATNGQTITQVAFANYSLGDRAFAQRVITSTYRQGAADGPVMATQSVPVMVFDTSEIIADHSVADLPTSISEGATVNLSASWINPVPAPFRANAQYRSTWQYTIYTPSSNINGSDSVQSTAGPLDTYPVGSEESHAYSFTIPDSCVCEVSVSHLILENGIVVAEERRDFTVDFSVPEVLLLNIDGNVVFDATQGLSTTAVASRSGSDLTVTVSDPTPNVATNGYEVFINGALAGEGTYPFITVDLDDFAPLTTQEDVALWVEVRDSRDGLVNPNPQVRQDVLFRPRNSSFNSPTPFLNFSNFGATLPETLESTTRFPLASDDSPVNPFGSLDCGAVWFDFPVFAEHGVELSTLGSSTSVARADGDSRQETALAVYRIEGGNQTLVAQIAPDGNPNVTNYPQEMTFDVTPGIYRVAVAASDMPANCDDDPTVSGPVVLRARQIDPPPFADVLSFLLPDPDADQFLLSQRGAVGVVPGFPDVDNSVNIGTALVDFTGTSYPSNLDSLAVAALGFDQCFDTPLEQSTYYFVAREQDAESMTLSTSLNAERLPALSNLTDGVQLEMAVFYVDIDDSLVLVGCEEGTAGADQRPTLSWDYDPDFSYIALIDTRGRQDGIIAPIAYSSHSSPFDPKPIDLSASYTTVSNTSGSIVDPVSTTCAQTFSGEHVFSRWLSWTAPSSDPVDIDMFGGADGALAVFEGNPSDGLDEIGCSDDPGSRPELIRITPVTGQTYRILVSSPAEQFGFSNADANFSVRVTNRADASSNELFEPGQFPLRTVVNTERATSGGMVGSCLSGDFASVHHRFETPTDPDNPVAPVLDLDIDTFGSDFDTTLVVENFAEEEGCNDDAFLGTRQSRVRLDDIEGTLFLQIDGFNGAVGNARINVTTRGDDWRNAVEVPGLNDGSTLDTTYASVEPNERRGDCHLDGDELHASVWWRFTPETSGIFNAIATGFDTQVTVFNAAAGAPDQVVGCGEDGVGLQGLAQFVAVAGEEYFIQVDGFEDAVGSATLFVQQTVTGLECGGFAPTILWGSGAVATEGRDVILGTGGNDVIDALGGDDVICGLNGNDTINGGAGNDTVFAGAGDDVVSGFTENDVLYGEDGEDRINGGAGDDTVFAGNDDDIVNGGGGVDTVYGGPGADTIGGQGGGDFLYGDEGNDRINGGVGDDLIEGGPGDDDLRGQGNADTLNGGEGVDQFFGGSGNDIINTGTGGNLGTTQVVRGQGNNDIINGSPQDDDLEGGSGLDELYGEGGNDRLRGGNASDDLYGGPGADTLEGGATRDFLYGGEGDDTLKGGTGNDDLFGEGGNDSLDGQGDTDLCDGGANSDTATATCETLANVP